MPPFDGLAEAAEAADVATPKVVAELLEKGLQPMHEELLRMQVSLRKVVAAHSDRMALLAGDEQSVASAALRPEEDERVTAFHASAPWKARTPMASSSSGALDEEPGAFPRKAQGYVANGYSNDDDLLGGAQELSSPEVEIIFESNRRFSDDQRRTFESSTCSDHTAAREQALAVKDRAKGPDSSSTPAEDDMGFRGHSDADVACDRMHSSVSRVSQVSTSSNPTRKTSSIFRRSNNNQQAARSWSWVTATMEEAEQSWKDSMSSMRANLKRRKGAKADKKAAQKIARGDAKGLDEKEDEYTRTGTKCEERFRAFLDWWEQLEEPHRTGCVARLCSSQKFESLCAAMILFNSGFLAYTSDQDMENPDRAPTLWVIMVEFIFIAFYTFELCIRLCTHRIFFFINQEARWNIFDSVLVLISLGDMYVTLVVKQGDDTQNMSYMRIFRLMKLAKIFRTLRVMRFFKDLSLILESFKHCMVSLFWSLVMLIFAMYVFALVFIQGMQGYISDRRVAAALSGETTTTTLPFDGLPDGLTGWVAEMLNCQDPDVETVVQHFFGSVSKSMLSLYMAVTGGRDWYEYYDIVRLAGTFYSFMFLFFTFFFVFALFNILTGVFVEKAVVAAQPDREELILQQRRKAIKDSEELKHLCQVLDRDQTGTITRTEFLESMQNDLMVSYMAAVGLEVRDVIYFFDLVVRSTKSEEVAIDSFVEGCMAMKGHATSLDIQRVLYETRCMETRLQLVLESFSHGNSGVANTPAATTTTTPRQTKGKLEENRPPGLNSPTGRSEKANHERLTSKQSRTDGSESAPSSPRNMQRNRTDHDFGNLSALLMRRGEEMEVLTPSGQAATPSASSLPPRSQIIAAPEPAMQL